MAFAGLGTLSTAQVPTICEVGVTSGDKPGPRARGDFHNFGRVYDVPPRSASSAGFRG